MASLQLVRRCDLPTIFAPLTEEQKVKVSADTSIPIDCMEDLAVFCVPDTPEGRRYNDFWIYEQQTQSLCQNSWTSVEVYSEQKFVQTFGDKSFEDFTQAMTLMGRPYHVVRRIKNVQGSSSQLIVNFGKVMK